jgi:L-asparaginase II
MRAAAPGRFLGKLGADGYYALGLLEHGLGLAVKLEDGAQAGPQYTVVCAVLARLGLLSAEEQVLLAGYISTPLLTVGKAVVGSREAAAGAFAGLSPALLPAL